MFLMVLGEASFHGEVEKLVAFTIFSLCVMLFNTFNGDFMAVRIH
jgi:hypothetical protein